MASPQGKVSQLQTIPHGSSSLVTTQVSNGLPLPIINESKEFGPNQLFSNNILVQTPTTTMNNVENGIFC
jgi:hypothetical protein